MDGWCTTETYFSQFQMLKVRDQGASVVAFWGESSSSFITGTFSKYPLGGRGKGSFWSLLYLALNTFMRVSLPWPKNFSQVLPPNTIIFGVRIQHEFAGEGHKHWKHSPSLWLSVATPASLPPTPYQSSLNSYNTNLFSVSIMLSSHEWYINGVIQFIIFWDQLFHPA